jgi:hypothetical protein
MNARSVVSLIPSSLLLCLALGACGDDDDGNAAAGQGKDAGRKPTGGSAHDAGNGKPSTPAGDRFSFFVTSYAAMKKLSGSEAGFGGDLRYGEADGLAGADKICREIAEGSLAGSGKKTWRAFLSVTQGSDGNPVHAIDRIGDGPWYDRLGRVVAETRADLMNARPLGADPLIANDLPNEDGVPNHSPDGDEVDNHDVLTGSDSEGLLYGDDWAATCHDWTSVVGTDGRPRVGHSWPRGFGDFMFGDGGVPPFPGMAGPGAPGGPPPGAGFPPFPGDGGIPPFLLDGGFGALFGDGGIDFASFDGNSWISALDEAGCAPGASLVEMGPPNPNNPTVGSGGGYGAIYCSQVCLIRVRSSSAANAIRRHTRYVPSNHCRGLFWIRSSSTSRMLRSEPRTSACDS